MNKKNKIFVDMDGVLADFEGGFFDKYGLDCAKLDKETAHFYKKKMKEDDFFLSLKPFDGAKDFIEYLFDVYGKQNVEILTAVAEYDSENNAAHKHAWIKKHISGDIVFNYVVKSKNKYVFADPSSVLIDDRDKALVPFAEAGGMIVKHFNFADSIFNLKQVKPVK